MKYFHRLILILFIFLIFLGSFTGLTNAVSEEDCRRYEEKGEWESAESCWHEYFAAKKRTLKNEIDSKNVQIDLTTKKIVSTQQNIGGLEKEIEVLGGKIVELDGSLDQLSEILVNRIAQTYKKGKLDPLVLLFSSSDFAKFVNRYKYLQVIQANDRKLILQMETSRSAFQDQKELKEERQIELRKWQRYLENEKLVLDQTVQAKKVLLSETEATYQRILARISAEKTKLAGASFFGEPAEFKQWPSENHYFNQTDSRWAFMLIGGGVYSDPNDPSYMWRYGCAVSSMAMVLHKWGVSIDPGQLSQSSVYRSDLMAWQDIPGAYGGQIAVTGHGYGGIVSWEKIDETLAGGNWVIVYISGVGHYVVLMSQDGSDYRMHDPYFGPNLSFSSKYSQGAVDEMIIYTR